MEIADSARRHGIDDDDIRHALRHPIADRLEAGRWLVIGAGRGGALVEIVILDPLTDEPIVIHAMPLRESFRRRVTRR